MERRAFLGGLLAAAPAVAALQTPDTTDAGRLWDPTRAGRPMTPRGERDNDEAIKAIERRLRCTCGCNLDVYTCRTTDFTCTVSPAMHRAVLARWDEGQTAEEIVAAFVAEHGEQILMAPPKEGFNLVGYAMPFAALAVGLTVLVTFLRYHARRVRASAAPAAADLPPDVDATTEELARLDEELRSSDL